MRKFIRIFCEGMLLAICAFNIFWQTRIHVFKQLFQDALPGRKLPAIAEFVLGAQVFSIVLASILMIFAMYVVFFSRESRQELLLVLSTLLVIAQLAFTTVAVLALFRPMTGLLID